MAYFSNLVSPLSPLASHSCFSPLSFSSQSLFSLSWVIARWWLGWFWWSCRFCWVVWWLVTGFGGVVAGLDRCLWCEFLTCFCVVVVVLSCGWWCWRTEKCYLNYHTKRPLKSMDNDQLDVLVSYTLWTKPKLKTQLYHFIVVLIANMGFFTDSYDLFCVFLVNKLFSV